MTPSGPQPARARRTVEPSHPLFSFSERSTRWLAVIQHHNSEDALPGQAPPGKAKRPGSSPGPSRLPSPDVSR